MIPPDQFDSIGMLLPQLYAIVRGKVTDISYDYLDCQGPRTVVKLSRIETLIGEKVDSEIELRTFGGPLPNGNYVSASELPRFASTRLLLCSCATLIGGSRPSWATWRSAKR